MPGWADLNAAQTQQELDRTAYPDKKPSQLRREHYRVTDVTIDADAMARDAHKEEAQVQAAVRAGGCGSIYLLGWAGNSPVRCGAPMTDLTGRKSQLLCPDCTTSQWFRYAAVLLLGFTTKGTRTSIFTDLRPIMFFFDPMRPGIAVEAPRFAESIVDMLRLEHALHAQRPEDYKKYVCALREVCTDIDAVSALPDTRFKVMTDSVLRDLVRSQQPSF